MGLVELGLLVLMSRLLTLLLFLEDLLVLFIALDSDWIPVVVEPHQSISL